MRIFLVLLIFVGVLDLLALLASIIVSRSISRKPSNFSDTGPIIGQHTNEDFVSVHVAIYDEPPELVIATLDALARSDYGAFEVIVVDNNTPDPAVWQPVADHVDTLGSRFRFFHFDDVKGAKAGALNLALELTDGRAGYVAIVDADYQVSAEFLATALAKCSAAVQFVQFPQAYRCEVGAGAVVNELADYFETYPRAANRAQSALLTGTLSVISIDALRRVGGWPTRSITEDAELGLKLWSAGARGLYINRAVGSGILPVDLQGLRLQRRRWVTGNVQTLIGGSRTLFAASRGSSAVLAQLTAWVGWLAIPLTTLIVVAVARSWPDIEAMAPEWAWQAAEAISVATFLCALIGHVTRALAKGRVSTLAVTMALLWTSSFAWLDVLRFRRPRFLRTSKVASTRHMELSIDTIGSLAAILASLAFLIEGSYITTAVLLLSAAGLFTGPFVDQSLRQASLGV